MRCWQLNWRFSCLHLGFLSCCLFHRDWIWLNGCWIWFWDVEIINDLIWRGLIFKWICFDCINCIAHSWEFNIW